MTSITVTEGFQVRPAGQYSARIVALTAEPGRFDAEQALKWQFAIGGDNENTQWAWSSAKVSPRSKAGGWIRNILGALPPAGSQFDTETLVGRDVVITLSESHDESGQTVNRVEDVRAAPPNQAALRTSDPVGKDGVAPF